jgi:hypothetical protein
MLMGCTTFFFFGTERNEGGEGRLLAWGGIIEVEPGKTVRLTIGRVLFHDFHGPNDARLLAVGVVEESQVAFLHGTQVVPSRVVADAWGRILVSLLIQDTNIDGTQPVHRESKAL